MKWSCNNNFHQRYNGSVVSTSQTTFRNKLEKYGSFYIIAGYSTNKGALNMEK
jgi:hypothetical protein